MTAAPRRRWFRRGLLAISVAIAIFVGWAGYQINWISERHEFLRSHAQYRNDGLLVYTDRKYTQPAGQALPIKALPWSLRLLGERPLFGIWSAGKGVPMPPELELHLKRLFPEAHVGASPFNLPVGMF